MFYLGEYASTPALVSENLRQKVAVTRALAGSNFDVHVSVDPTQIGFSIDRQQARENLFTIAEEIKIAAGSRPGVHCLMVDMEDSTVTEPTLKLSMNFSPLDYQLLKHCKLISDELRAI